MLPAQARLRRSQDFGLTVRRGRRAGKRRLVVHALRTDTVGSDVAGKNPARDGELPGESGGVGRSRQNSPTRDPRGRTRVGFVVSKAVGNAVTRHQVARRLRHLMRDRLPAMPAGILVVVRALPPSASADSYELARDLDAALRKLDLVVPGEAEIGGDHTPTETA